MRALPPVAAVCAAPALRGVGHQAGLTLESCRWTTKQMLDSLDNPGCRDVCGKVWKGLRSKLRETHYTHCVILAGTNDVGRCEGSAEDIFKNINKLANVARDHGCEAIVMTIPELREEKNPRFRNMEQTRIRANHLLMQSQSINTIDLSIVVPYHSLSRTDRDRMWEHDGLHMRPAGYTAIAHALAARLQGAQVPQGSGDAHPVSIPTGGAAPHATITKADTPSLALPAGGAPFENPGQVYLHYKVAKTQEEFCQFLTKWRGLQNQTTRDLQSELHTAIQGHREDKERWEQERGLFNARLATLIAAPPTPPVAQATCVATSPIQQQQPKSVSPPRAQPSPDEPGSPVCAVVRVVEPLLSRVNYIDPKDLKGKLGKKQRDIAESAQEFLRSGYVALSSGEPGLSEENTFLRAGHVALSSPSGSPKKWIMSDDETMPDINQAPDYEAADAMAFRSHPRHDLIRDADV